MTPSRPAELTEQQAEALAAGTAPTVGAQSRPRDLTTKQVESLRAGKDVDLERVRELQPTEHPAGARHDERNSRPRAVSDDDVAALQAGRDIGLEEREPLADQ
jgi:hypothetical protein